MPNVSRETRTFFVVVFHVLLKTLSESRNARYRASASGLLFHVYRLMEKRHMMTTFSCSSATTTLHQAFFLVVFSVVATRATPFAYELRLLSRHVFINLKKAKGRQRNEMRYISRSVEQQQRQWHGCCSTSGIQVKDIRDELS